MLEPQGTLFFILLLVAFGGLVYWLVRTRQAVLRVLAALLAFLPAMVFGIAVVNKYYDYYQSWGSLVSDLSGSTAQSVPQPALSGLSVAGGNTLSSAVSGSVNAAVARQEGYLFREVVAGPRSHIRREVYIYLPPQYFSAAYKNYRFPAVELLHGSPGQPESWINVMDVIPIYLGLLASKQATPAVLVMPDTEGGLRYSLQCLNDPGGLQDMTYVGAEVPDWVSDHLRVEPPGQAWGIAGYSEGGFCAANIGLQYATRFRYVGSLSGYFAPSNSQVPAHNKPGGAPVDVNDFAKDPSLLLRNTPQQYILHVPLSDEVPYFWLAAGAADASDVQAARYFRELLLTRTPVVPLMIVPGGGHQAKVWRAALGPMLQWMTPQLTVQANDLAVEASRAAAQQRAHEKAVQAQEQAREKASRLGGSTVSGQLGTGDAQVGQLGGTAPRPSATP